MPEFTSYCVFDNSVRTEHPFSTPSGKWGKGSNDEMCIDFLWFVVLVAPSFRWACMFTFDFYDGHTVSLLFDESFRHTLIDTFSLLSGTTHGSQVLSHARFYRLQRRF